MHPGIRIYSEKEARKLASPLTNGSPVPKIPISPGTGFVADASSSHIGRVSPTRACSSSILLLEVTPERVSTAFCTVATPSLRKPFS